MINIKVNASLLCDLLAPKFTYDACEAICEYLEEFESESFYLGDIAISFCEIDADEIEDYEEDSVIAVLKNGNAVIAQ